MFVGVGLVPTPLLRPFGKMYVGVGLVPTPLLRPFGKMYVGVGLVPTPLLRREWGVWGSHKGCTYKDGKVNRRGWETSPAAREVECRELEFPPTCTH